MLRGIRRPGADLKLMREELDGWILRKRYARLFVRKFVLNIVLVINGSVGATWLSGIS